MKPGTLVGIFALFFSFVGAWTPGLGLMIGWGALLVACLAALYGDRAFTILTILSSAFAFVFMTPSLWVEAFGVAMANSQGGNYTAGLRVVSIVLLIAPIGCMVLNATGRFALNRAVQKISSGS